MSAVPEGVEIIERTHLREDEIAAVIALVDRVTEHDGMRPLSEHVWLHLKEGGDPHGRHLVGRRDDGTVVAYAHLDVTDPVDGPSAELAVDPSERRHGLGRELVTDLIAASPDGRMRLWAHGEQAGAAELATGMGFRLTRALWQMRRSLYAPLAKAEIPAGIHVRPFRVGVDEDAWLDLNARAFIALPDQGSWTFDDLDRRLREPWFSAEGFLMAWSGSHLLGFHWTKVHGRLGEDRQHHHQPIGEVYVVGVDPQLRGSGLGRALTLAGLHHLRSLDLSQAMLYVDATNVAAIGLYESLGFVHWDTDVLFRLDA
jgi:mycothiol synthase